MSGYGVCFNLVDFYLVSLIACDGLVLGRPTASKYLNKIYRGNILMNVGIGPKPMAKKLNTNKITL